MVNQNTISTNIALNNRRMGEKARSTNVQDVCWCCKFLDRTTELFPGYFGLQGDREEKERGKKGEERKEVRAYTRIAHTHARNGHCLPWQVFGTNTVRSRYSSTSTATRSTPSCHVFLQLRERCRSLRIKGRRCTIPNLACVGGEGRIKKK